MEAIYEFVIHFADLKNIDLRSQGLYYVRSKIFTERTNPETGEVEVDLVARPYLIIDNYEHSGNDDNKYYPSSISYENYYFHLDLYECNITNN
eukprot:TRINITY_DN6267_c0_g1_i1.p1 TRINITY_DN6267_c0_g1~~TRINITY_DN6267_c0_g1_i1.p1  ORF type:complete len:93 (-),score=8.04 TRINITY_DN6267_c0_g1_i1:150-428(-)